MRLPWLFRAYSIFSFKDITALARGLHAGCSRVTDAKLPMIIVLEQDIGKVLGQSLKVLNGGYDIICVDQIIVNEGDYIDIGKSVAGGNGCSCGY